MGRNYVPHGQDSSDVTGALQVKKLNRQAMLDSSMDFITGAVTKAPRAEDQVSRNKQTKDYPRRTMLGEANKREFEKTLYMSNNRVTSARVKKDGPNSGMGYKS